MSTLIDDRLPELAVRPCRDRDVSPRCLGERMSRTAVISRMKSLKHGELTLVEGNSSQTFGRANESCPLNVTLTVLHPRFFPRVMFGGDIGAAESFMDGDWSCDDLTSLVRILVVNSRSDSAEPGWL